MKHMSRFALKMAQGLTVVRTLRDPAAQGLLAASFAQRPVYRNEACRS